MRGQNHIETTGVILSRSSSAFLGSCFFFRSMHTVVTAHHCVKDVPVSDLLLMFPGAPIGLQGLTVKRVTHHPTADVAVLELNPTVDPDFAWTVHNLFNDVTYGLDVATFGYPAEWDQGRPRPQPRFFQGYVQRFFEHRSHMGYRYTAVELSFTCPAGLSGSPIINREFHGRLYGVVTENVRVSTEVESVLEVDDKGERYKESFHRILSYGVAVWLPSVQDWMDSAIPPPSDEEIARRAAILTGQAQPVGRT